MARWSAHPTTGKYRRTRLFVLTLGYSRKAVRLLVWHSSAQVWAELHERAFRRLGGTVRVIVIEAAMRIGPSVRPICDHIHRHEGEAGVRRMLGVLALTKKHRAGRR